MRVVGIEVYKFIVVGVLRDIVDVNAVAIVFPVELTDEVTAAVENAVEIAADKVDVVVVLVTFCEVNIKVKDEVLVGLDVVVINRVVSKEIAWWVFDFDAVVKLEIVESNWTEDPDTIATPVEGAVLPSAALELKNILLVIEVIAVVLDAVLVALPLSIWFAKVVVAMSLMELDSVTEVEGI